MRENNGNIEFKNDVNRRRRLWKGPTFIINQKVDLNWDVFVTGATSFAPSSRASRPSRANEWPQYRNAIYDNGAIGQ